MRANARTSGICRRRDDGDGRNLHGQHAAGSARRADAGTVRLGQRDIDGLILCAEHGGAPYDLLAAALARRAGPAARDHRTVAAGRVRRHRAARARPGVVLADPGRDDRRRAGLPGRAAPAGPPGPPARGAGRPAVVHRQPGLGPGPGHGGSPNGASAAKDRPPAPTAPTPRSTGPSIAASPYGGQVWAIEVELTAKHAARTAPIMTGLAAPAGYAQVLLPDRPGRAGRGRPAAPTPSPPGDRPVTVRDLPPAAYTPPACERERERRGMMRRE